MGHVVTHRESSLWLVVVLWCLVRIVCLVFAFQVHRCRRVTILSRAGILVLLSSDHSKPSQSFVLSKTQALISSLFFYTSPSSKSHQHFVLGQDRYSHMLRRSSVGRAVVFGYVTVAWLYFQRNDAGSNPTVSATHIVRRSAWFEKIDTNTRELGLLYLILHWWINSEILPI